MSYNVVKRIDIIYHPDLKCMVSYGRLIRFFFFHWCRFWVSDLPLACGVEESQQDSARQAQCTELPVVEYNFLGLLQYCYL